MSLEDAPENVQPQVSKEPLPEESEIALTADDRQWAMFCHLSALLGLLVGGLTFVGPLVCWLMKKDQSKFVDYHGKEALNFQLNILVYTLIAFGITVATCGFAFPVIFVPLIYGIVMPIIAGMKANEGKYYEYPATLRVIK
jgi:hypothetical protein